MLFRKQNFYDKNKEAIIAGVLFGSGLVIGSSLTALFLGKKKKVNGDRILDSVKKMFLADGPIEGSWIELHPAPLTRFSSETDVYYGGISRKENDELIQYEFMADAYTGTILDIYKL